MFLWLSWKQILSIRIIGSVDLRPFCQAVPQEHQVDMCFHQKDQGSLSHFTTSSSALDIIILEHFHWEVGEDSFSVTFLWSMWSASESRSVVSDFSATPWTIQSMEFSRPEYGVGSLSLLWGIFPTQGSNQGVPLCRWILYTCWATREALWSIVHFNLPPCLLAIYIYFLIITYSLSIFSIYLCS